MTLFISCPAILLLHFILSLFLSRSFFYRFLRFSFTCIVSILCLAPHLNSDNLCSLFSSGPSFSFVPSRVWCQLFFLCSPLVPFLWSFSLASCHYIFFGFLLLSRSPSSIDPSQSFFLVPLPSSFFSLISVPRSVHCSLRFSSVSCHAMYIKNICIPASFPFRSGRVPVPFPFRFLSFRRRFCPVPVSFSFRWRLLFVSFSFRWRLLPVPAAFWHRLLFVSFSFSFRPGRVPAPSLFRFPLVPAAFRPRLLFVSF